MAVAAQLMTSIVTRVVSAPKCGPLSVAVCVAGGGDGFMAVVSSMVLEIGFPGVFSP